VQVDPVKPTLKAPGYMHLKLRDDGPVSKLGFKSNLRRYTPAMSSGRKSRRSSTSGSVATPGRAVQVDPIISTLKALETDI
jgi:hypothetical protein